MTTPQQRYYERNRERICARMRERQRERQAILDHYSNEIPELKERLESRRLEKNQRVIDKRNMEALRNLIDSPDTHIDAKRFLLRYVWSMKTRISHKFVKNIESLIRAYNEANGNTPDEVDGPEPDRAQEERVVCGGDAEGEEEAPIQQGEKERLRAKIQSRVSPRKISV